jgi:hypothetical protein
MDDNADLTAHELLQDIYRNEEVPLPVRMRAAIESLPYETPKLQAIAHFNGNMAELLDAAIERRSMKLIEHVPVPEPVPTETHAPDELKGSFPKLRRRI